MTIPQKKGDAIIVRHRRAPACHHAWKRWPNSKAWCGPDGTVTAGNASGVNDGACALLLANDEASASQYNGW